MKSKIWLHRQQKDLYVKKARKEGYLSRSAYKLLELNKKFKFFNNCKVAIDLGSYPGGWSKILKKNT